LWKKVRIPETFQGTKSVTETVASKQFGEKCHRKGRVKVLISRERAESVTEMETVASKHGVKSVMETVASKQFGEKCHGHGQMVKRNVPRKSIVEKYRIKCHGKVSWKKRFSIIKPSWRKVMEKRSWKTHQGNIIEASIREHCGSN
jgi:hypothetical protein